MTLVVSGTLGLKAREVDTVRVEQVLTEVTLSKVCTCYAMYKNPRGSDGSVYIESISVFVPHLVSLVCGT